MPELPEVQTTVKDLEKKIIGLRIIDVWTDAPKLIKRPSFETFKKQIKGAKIEKISRRGKNILIRLNPKSKTQKSKLILLIHQKLTGHLLYGSWIMKEGLWVPAQKGPLEERVNQYIHLLFFLNNGKMLALSDLRKFAKVILGPKEEIENLAELKNLGIEPLDRKFTFEKFKEIIQQTPSKRKIKQVLMDQTIISGIGNIYSDEILWEAKIHPFKLSYKLNNQELKAIYQAIKKILTKAIKLRGTSISDFRDPEGREGKYTEIRSVYQREGEPCYRCGSKIKRVKIGGRSAYFCPQCQKA